MSALHYLAAAGASRAAAGVRLPVRELLAAQFTASAANRLTPAGLGAAGVLGRFRRVPSASVRIDARSSSPAGLIVALRLTVAIMHPAFLVAAAVERAPDRRGDPHRLDR